jgi:excisionase family DNA binding protein
MDNMRNDKLLTVTEAAEMLGVSPATIRRAIDKGELPGFRVPGSRHRRVLRTEIERYISQGKAQDTEA